MNDIATPASFDTALLGLKNQNTAPSNLKKIEETSKEFEGMFISEMMNHMFEGIETDPMFGGGHGEDMFRSMMIGEYGKMISQGPGIGISTEIKRAMIDIQQKQGKV